VPLAIARALALVIAGLPTKPKVIATGRRKDRLEELAKAGLETFEVDLDINKAGWKKFTDDIVTKYPDLDTVILCAGVQHELPLKEGFDFDNLTNELNINYTSIVATITFLLPHFLKLSAQGRHCFVAPISSALGITPAPSYPNYSASKAALHSFSISLGVQLKDTNVHVMEILPPLVESELHDNYGTTEALSKFWMPLEQYTKETVAGLQRGDQFITCGTATDVFNKYETGKVEVAENIQKMSQKVHAAARGDSQ